jgi:hypothetical protein
MSTTTEFLRDRIEATKAQIVALEEAALQLSTGAIQSYTLNTLQSQQTVTKANLATLYNQIDRLLNRLAVLDARINGAGRTRIIPAW